MKRLRISSPLITTSPTIASLFSIITDFPSASNWIVNHFNNLLYIESNDENRCIFFEDQPSNRETIFAEINFFRYSKIKYDIIDIFCENIIDFLEKSLDADYFVRLTLDNYYLSLSQICYQKEHIYHPLLIFGYDSHHKVFEIGEFFNGKKFSFYQISYEEIQSAYNYEYYYPSETEEYLENIILLKLEKNYICESINISKIVTEINDYLLGTDTSNKYKNRIRKKDSNYSYGVNCYMKFIQSLNNSCYDFRSAHVFCDRMHLHTYKLDILFQSNVLSVNNYQLLKKEARYLENLSLQYRNAFLKYLIKYNSCIPPKAICILTDSYSYLQQNECSFLSKLVNILTRFSKL